MFSYKHFVQFYETDPMNIVHHGNYIRFYEEARVAWAHELGLILYQKPESASWFAVLETHIRHVKPVHFGDTVEIFLQAKLERAKIIFEYKMHCPSRGNELVSVARTTHVSLDKQNQLIRPPDDIKRILEKTAWIETWLSNL